MQVPYLELGPTHEYLTHEIDEAIRRVRERSCFILGVEGERFEAQLAADHDTLHAVGVGSGFDALALTMRALRLGPGDEVITAAHASIATVSSILAANATPILVDVDEDNLAMHPASVSAAITPRTAAVLVVHPHGRIAPILEIQKVAERHGLPVIEDVAQAYGAQLDNAKAGTFGAAGCLSFHPSCQLGALGDAGAVVTDDDDLAQRLRKLRNHGASSDHYHDIAGFNSRLDEIQAAVLRTKLANIDLFHRERRRLAKRYIDELEMNVMIPCLPRSDADGLDHIYHHMVICLQNRDAVRDRLAQRGVQTEIHYPVPVHLQKALADLGYKKGSFPTAEAAANDVLSLPLYFGLSDEQQDYVIKSLLKSL